MQAFRERPLDQGPYPYVWLDALSQRVREGGRVVHVAVVVATAVNGQGQREVLGFDCGSSEDGTFWLSCLPAGEEQQQRAALGFWRLRGVGGGTSGMA